MTHVFRSRAARTLTIAWVLALSAGAHARDMRMHGPNSGGGSCAEATTLDDTEAPGQLIRKQTVREKAKVAPMVRSTGESTARPRWHSILPGMFR